MEVDAKVPAELAELALALIKKQFAPYVEPGYEPELDWFYEDKLCVIKWPHGPLQWTYVARCGGIAQDYDWPEITDWPDGIWCEAIDEYTLNLLPSA